MKTSIYKIFLIALGAVVFWSCDKDDETTIMTAPTAPVLSISQPSTILKSEEAQTTDGAKFSWYSTGYGFDANVIYSVQVDKAGNNFANAAELVLKDLKSTADQNIAGFTSTLSSYTLDSLIHKIGLTEATASDVEIRLKSTTKDADSEPVFSDPVTINVTPYRDVVEAEPVLTSSVTTFGSSTSDPVSFSWTAADYSLENEISYVLEFDSVESFAEPLTIEVSDLSKEYSAIDFNTLIQNAGIVLETESNLYVRLKSTQAGSFTAPVYSNALTILATPFKAYPDNLYLVGGSTSAGWTPANALPFKKITDGKFEIYHYLDPAGGGFKFLQVKDWAGDWGKGIDGELLQEGESNVEVAAAGFYRIICDYTNKTYQVQNAGFGVIGNATPTGWDSDTDLVYDAADKKLKITLTLSVGEIKFRANDAWDLNYGDNSVDNVLEEGGANIPVAEAGEYDIVLDFNDPAQYTYSLTKK